MTFWELVRSLIRNWVIVLIGAVATVGCGLVAVSDDGVYFTRTELVFLAPTSSLYPNALRTQSEDIIMTAGIVAKRVSGPGKITKYASQDVTLVGLGVREGWSLRLPDIGGQWATNFVTQRLFLDIVAPTPDAVRAQQDELIRRVERQLAALQRQQQVDPVNDITVMTAPQSTTIYHVGPSRIRALGMTAVLGIGATIAAVVFKEYAGRRCARRRVREHTGAVSAIAETAPVH